MSSEYPLFDYALHEVEDEKSNAADDWFKTLRETIHAPLFATPHDHHPVRVAIIGAGVDFSHPEIDEAQKERKIVQCRGFPESLNPCEDEQGHGTYSVSVILRTMPWVSLYVARVVDQTGHLVEDEKYRATVQAIEWAVQHKVDIISMPWGIQKEITSISNALAKAHKAGIVNLAAGMNPSAGRLNPFPANLYSVLSIGSSNAYGQPLQQSLLFLATYATLGEAVLGASVNEPATGKGKQPERHVVRKTGSSISTCVATGLAAILMEYVRRYLELDAEIMKFDKAKIEQSFLIMSDTSSHEAYHYISPWKLFGPNQDSKDIMDAVMKKKWPMIGRFHIEDVLIVVAVIPHLPPQSLFGTSTVESPFCVIPWESEPPIQFVERGSTPSDALSVGLAKHPCMVITGNSSSGKTELVKKYVRKARESNTYQGIFWIDATTEESTIYGIHSISEKMKAPRPESPDQTTWNSRLKWELNRYSQAPFLLVLDNANDLGIIKKYLYQPPILTPDLQQVARHFIITTPHRDAVFQFDNPVANIHLEQLNAIESETLFSNVYYGTKRDLTDESTNDLLEDLDCSQSSFTSLFETVGGSPLSIIIAAAYIRETGQPIPTYLNIYRNHRTELCRAMSVEDDNYLSVAVTVVISLHQIIGTEAIQLLCLLAFMSPSEIPLSVFTADPRFRDSKLRNIFSSREKLDNTLQHLHKFRFINRWNGSLSMNRLVQQILRDIIEVNGLSNQMTNQSPTDWIERAIELLQISYPINLVVRVLSLKVFESLYPHAAQVTLHAESYNIANMEFAGVQLSTGLYWTMLNVSLAAQIHQRALKKIETVFGVDHINTAQIIGHIMGPLVIQQKHDEIIKQERHVLQIQEKVFGFEDIALISNIVHTAQVLGTANRYEDEIFHYRWAIKICEKVYGVSCAATHDAINRLASTYTRLGRSMDAIREWQRAVDSIQGPLEDIPSGVTFMMKNIAIAFQRQRKIDEAIQQYERILQILERGDVTDGVGLGDTLNNLGSLYMQKAQYDQALQQYERLQQFEDSDDESKVFPMAIGAIANLNLLQRNYSKALDGYKEQLNNVEKRFGDEPTWRALPLMSIGGVYEAQKMYKEAIEYYERALAIQERDEKPGFQARIIEVLRRIAQTHFIQLQYNESLRHDLRASEIGNQMIGQSSPLLCSAMHSAGANLLILGRFDEALMQLQAASMRATTDSGYESHNNTMVLETIGSVYASQGKYELAMATYESVLQIRERLWGKDSTGTSSCLDFIAHLYWRQHKYEEAMQTFERIYSIEPGLPNVTAGILASMGHLNDDLGKYELALEQKMTGLTMIENTDGFVPIHAARMIAEIARGYNKRGNHEEAMKHAEGSLKIRQEELGLDHMEVAESYEVIGDIYVSIMEYDRAMREYQRALQIKNSVFGRDHQLTAKVIGSIGNIQTCQKKFAEALASHQRELRILEKSLGASHFETYHPLMNIGINHDKLGDYETAIDYLNRALYILERECGVGHIDSYDVIMRTAVTYMHQRKHEKAIRQMRQILSAHEARYGMGHINTARTVMYMGLVLHFKGCDAEADEYLTQCQSILESKLGHDHPWLRELRETIEEEMNLKKKLSEPEVK